MFNIQSLLVNIFAAEFEEPKVGISDKGLSYGLLGIVNSLPKDKFSDWSELEAFADDNINVTEKLKSVLGRVENMVKGGKASYQHFLLFLQCF